MRYFVKKSTYPLVNTLLWGACNLTSFSPCLTGPVDYPFASCHKGPVFKTVMCYGPQRRNLLSAINCSRESLATAPNQLKFIEKIATTFKGKVRPKKCIFTKFTIQGLCYSCLNLSQLWSNLILRFWPLRRMRFELKNFCEFEVEFKTVFGHKSVYQVGSICEKTWGLKSCDYSFNTENYFI
jgi:hypothetical protein